MRRTALPITAPLYPPYKLDHTADVPGSELSIIASSLASLAILLAALLGAAWLARRLRATRFGAGQKNSAAITIIATRSLGPATALLIVQAQGQNFLIASARSGITALGRLDPP